jgi:hypothetical protein
MDPGVLVARRDDCWRLARRARDDTDEVCSCGDLTLRVVEDATRNVERDAADAEGRCHGRDAGSMAAARWHSRCWCRGWRRKAPDRDGRFWR